MNFNLATQFKLGQAFQNMNERPFSITRREVVRLMDSAATATLFPWSMNVNRCAPIAYKMPSRHSATLCAK
jgi:hypothetical protein